MKSLIVAGVALALGAIEVEAQISNASFSSRMLPNGIRLACVEFPGSTNVSIFSYLPLGLANDEAGQAQWSHLVEHLVIRSTMSADSMAGNAETLPDHMRLDFYGTMQNWEEGLSHHRRWLEGVKVPESSLQAEKPKVNGECDYTARNFATHKFAVAAWNQAWRHGKTNIAIKGDVDRANLAEVQRLLDARLVVSNRVTVCVVGGLSASAAFGKMEEALGSLKLKGVEVPKIEPKGAAGTFDVRWDLDARHLLVTWRIPGPAHNDYPALLLAAQALNMRLAANPDLQPQIGNAYAGADLATPEGSYFFVSASLRPGGSFEKVYAAMGAVISELTSHPSALAMTAQIGRQMSSAMTEIPDPTVVKAQAPPQVTLGMIEGNLGLQLGLSEHRFGSERVKLAKRLSVVTTENAHAAIKKYLTPGKGAVLRIDQKNAP